MTDLTAITTPFGLLDRETQEALKAHGGPLEVFSNDGIWRTTEDPSWVPYIAIRVKFASPKPREWWVVGKIAMGSEEEAVASRIEWNRISPGCHMLELPIIHVREVLPE